MSVPLRYIVDWFRRCNIFFRFLLLQRLGRSLPFFWFRSSIKNVLPIFPELHYHPRNGYNRNIISKSNKNCQKWKYIFLTQVQRIKSYITRFKEVITCSKMVRNFRDIAGMRDMHLNSCNGAMCCRPENEVVAGVLILCCRSGSHFTDIWPICWMGHSIISNLKWEIQTN